MNVNREVGCGFNMNVRMINGDGRTSQGIGAAAEAFQLGFQLLFLNSRSNVHLDDGLLVGVFLLGGGGSGWCHGDDECSE